jgi:hypothetical protein
VGAFDNKTFLLLCNIPNAGDVRGRGGGTGGDPWVIKIIIIEFFLVFIS